MTISIRAAIDADRYTIATIRNSGREYMTHNTSYITPEEQDKWWFSPNRESSRIWIARNDYKIIGFCMIREMYDSGRSYGTLALLPEYRGHGIGTQLYQFMTQQIDELWIDVRNDNVASMNAALKAGFEIYNIGAEVTELLYRKE